MRKGRRATKAKEIFENRGPSINILSTIREKKALHGNISQNKGILSNFKQGQGQHPSFLLPLLLARL